MPRRRLTRAEQQAKTRERILQAAEKVLLSDGLSGATIEQIAARAGYSTGAVYSNFRSKEELAVAVLERCNITTERIWAEAVEERVAARDVDVARRQIREFVEQLRPVFALTLEVWRELTDPHLRRRLLAYPRHGGAHVADLLTREAEAAGTEPRLPVDRAAGVVGALVNGLLVIDFLGLDFDIDQTFRDTIALVLGLAPS